jgi:hypothetical protein
VVSASVGGFFDDGFMVQFKDNFYMAISAGNEGVEGEGMGSEKPYWTSIGAVTPELIPADYSSWGKGLVSHVGITNEEINYVYFGEKREYIQGTSFACPQHATQIMNMMMLLYSKYGVKPSMKDVLAIRDKYTKDIFTIGKDFRTGNGYYEWKDGEDYMSEIKMVIGGKEIIVNNNGESKIVKSNIPIQAIDGVTVLPLRIISEILGVTVKYDNTTKTITLLKV